MPPSLDWSLAVHVSAPDGNGWAFAETYAPSDPLAAPAWAAYTNEIFQIKLDGTEVRSLPTTAAAVQQLQLPAHVSVSRDGNRLVYNSNFGLQASSGYPAEYSDVYFIAVPSSSPDSAALRHLEQDSTLVGYSGPWYTNMAASHSGGSAS